MSLHPIPGREVPAPQAGSGSTSRGRLVLAGSNLVPNHTRPSVTAQFGALIRTIERKLPASERIIDDPLAPHFLGIPVRLFSRLLHRGLHGNQEYGATRNRFFDDQIVQRMNEGIRQVVQLAVGYETGAYRHAREGVRFFDVDLEPLLTRKARCLAKHGISRPEGLVEISLDLETGDLAAALSAHGFDRAAPAHVVWSGGSYYVTRESTVELLRTLREILAPGSTVAFDYPLEAVLSAEGHYPGLTRTLMLMRGTGEPWRFGTTAAEVARIAEGLGYGEPSIVSTETLRSYLPANRSHYPLMGYAEIATLPC